MGLLMFQPVGFWWAGVYIGLGSWGWGGPFKYPYLPLLELGWTWGGKPLDRPGVNWGANEGVAPRLRFIEPRGAPSCVPRVKPSVTTREILKAFGRARYHVRNCLLYTSPSPRD